MSRRRVALIAGLFVVAAACSNAALAVSPGASLAEAIDTAPPGSVLRLPAGDYSGPVVIDRPIQLLAEPGATLQAPPDSPAILIESDDVTIRDLAVRGGDPGIHVVKSVNVHLDRVDVHGAQWHGILADDSSVTVTDCHISGLQAAMPQGFEIRNSANRPESLVEGCTIEGPVYQGIVSHVSRVRFIDNVVSRSADTGVMVTEMSDGRMEGNTVENAQGTAYYCGDMSDCSVVDNVADGIAGSPRGNKSDAGHGLVVHSMARAFVDGLTVDDLESTPVAVLVQGQIVDESPYP